MYLLLEFRSCDTRYINKIYSSFKCWHCCEICLLLVKQLISHIFFVFIIIIKFIDFKLMQLVFYVQISQDFSNQENFIQVVLNTSCLKAYFPSLIKVQPSSVKFSFWKTFYLFDECMQILIQNRSILQYRWHFKLAPFSFQVQNTNFVFLELKTLLLICKHILNISSKLIWCRYANFVFLQKGSINNLFQWQTKLAVMVWEFIIVYAIAISKGKANKILKVHLNFQAVE